jgi:hypothetical protein
LTSGNELSWLARPPSASANRIGAALAELPSARDLIRELEFRVVSKR